MMHSDHEQKEDIRLRMVDLEKKLAESEEERSKLEKTCNMLMRAFREEEKMRYKVLNKKYEKFLEDCMVRNRRNDIILRSLCRIEDRSRMLFARTERLKLLKDRYISYLKINEFKQNEASHHLQRNIPPTTISEVTAKSVRWKTPLALSLKAVEEFREARGDFSRNERQNALANVLTPGSLEVKQDGPEKPDEFQEQENQRKSAARTLGADGHGPQLNVEIKSEDVASGEYRMRRAVKDDNKIDDKYPTDVSHHSDDSQGKSNEKRREAVESQRHDRKWLLSENENLKPNETDPVTVKINKLFSNNHHVMTPSPKNSSHKKNKNDLELENTQDIFQEKDIPSENSPETDKALPLGLDGIDYQNETYPESYYEQPVHHHNHTSIASDVILEEDETEQELEDEEKNLSTDGPFDTGPQPRNSWEQARGHRNVVEPRMKSASNTESDPPNKTYLKSGDVNEVFQNVKSEESVSEKNLQPQQTDRPKSSPSEKSDKSQSAGKSNLIHMLESDSESFQIEHGDGIPGNEDSDFDFSFSKN